MVTVYTRGLWNEIRRLNMPLAPHAGALSLSGQSDPSFGEMVKFANDTRNRAPMVQF